VGGLVEGSERELERLCWRPGLAARLQILAAAAGRRGLRGGFWAWVASWVGPSELEGGPHLHRNPSQGGIWGARRWDCISPVARHGRYFPPGEIVLGSPWAGLGR